MKYLAAKTLLALGFAGAFAATARAQVPSPYTQGDFLVGFRETGANYSVVVDLGQFTNFTTSMSFTINAGAALSAQYGSNWATNSSVFFSLSATGLTTDANSRTSYVTSPKYLTGPNAGTSAQVWGRLSNSNAIVLQNKINNLGNEFTNAAAGYPDAMPTAIPPYTGSGGELQSKSDADAYQNFMPGGTTDVGHATTANDSFGFFNPTIEGNFGQGTSGVQLDLIQLLPGSAGSPGNDLGYFQLSSDGNTLTFNTVPEPTGFVTMGVWGVLALLCFQVNKRRKSSTKEQSA